MFNLVRCQEYIYSVTAASPDAVQSCSPAAIDLKLAHWMRVAYPRVSAQVVAGTLDVNLPYLLYDCVTTSEAALVLIYKARFQNIRKTLSTLIQQWGSHNHQDRCLPNLRQAKLMQRGLRESWCLNSSCSLSNISATWPSGRQMK